MEEVWDDLGCLYFGRLLQRVRGHAVPAASYWLMYGMSMLFGLLTERLENPGDERRWKTLFIFLQACVPEQKMEDVREDVRSETESIWSDVGLTIFTRVFATSLTLGLGFVVHVLV